MKSVKTIGKSILKIGFLLFLFQLISLAAYCQNEALQLLQQKSPSVTGSSQEKEIALQIYFFDEMAFMKKNSDYFEYLFAEIKPDVEFRRIVIDSNDKDVQKLLRDELQKVLSEVEIFKYLIIDTHGWFSKENEHHLSSTYLKNVGWFDKNSVDYEFQKNFLPIKFRASSELQVILNSCSTFCGDKVDAQKRAQAFLSYFNAYNGSIYGSQTIEYEGANYDSKYKKVKGRRRLRHDAVSDFVHNLTIYMVLSAVLAGPDFNNMSFSNFIGTQLPLSITFGVLVSGTRTLVRLIYRVVESFTNNRGLLFTFKYGAPDQSFKVFKVRDMRKLISGKLCKNSAKKL